MDMRHSPESAGEPLAAFLAGAVDAAPAAGAVIRVSGRAGLTEAVVGTGLPFNDWHYLDDHLHSLREIMQRVAGSPGAHAALLDVLQRYPALTA